MQFRCARILLFSHRFGCLEHPAAFTTKAHAPTWAFSCTADLYHASSSRRHSCSS